ncbi:hypothetical protein DFQ26_004225 [Actinomortierella ambigua]|nr:hypothetical protein DFQ26_004225 [Actinomortierella ambigua]
MRIQVISTVFAAVLASKLADAAAVFQCPELYGTCNTCTRSSNGLLASLTRKVCEPYSEEQCHRLYGDESWLCDDGCNTCRCSNVGVMSTRMACRPYDLKDCMQAHGTKSFEIGNRLYECTADGIASRFKFVTHQ